MPHYEFTCKKCQESFITTLSLQDYEQGRAACPKCNSNQVEQRFSTGYAITSKKSAAA